MAKTIFIFNDGTGQYLGSDAPTNVAKIFSALPGEFESKIHTDKFKVDQKNDYAAIYIRGIGTVNERYPAEFKSEGFLKDNAKVAKAKVDFLAEQALGRTIVERVEDSLKAFDYVYEPGMDVKIILVGFSRGAASARIIASELLKRPGFKIDYMLLFDTVYSVTGQIKILDGEPIDRFTDFDINESVLRCDHLVAGDEMRDRFPLSPVNLRKGVRQILFAGSHSDVGGGHPSTNLSDISLWFALEEMKSMGIKFHPERESALKLNPNPLGPITWDTFGGTGQAHYPRPFADLDFLVHSSVIERANNKESISVGLAQLCSFQAPSGKELLEKGDIDASFDW